MYILIIVAFNLNCNSITPLFIEIYLVHFPNIVELLLLYYCMRYFVYHTFCDQIVHNLQIPNNIFIVSACVAGSLRYKSHNEVYVMYVIILFLVI